MKGRDKDIYTFLMGVGSKFLNFIKWVAIAVATGVLVGLTGTAFSYGMQYATDFRTRHPAVILGLPVAGPIGTMTEEPTACFLRCARRSSCIFPRLL